MTFYTLDTETRGLFGKVFRWKMYDGNTICEEGYNAIEINEMLLEYPDEHIYIHNLEFDLGKMIKAGLKFDLDTSKIINRSVVTATIPQGPTLHCSFHILRSSLDRLSKSFELGIEAKMDLNEALNDYVSPIDGKTFTDKLDFFKHVSPHDPLLNDYLDFDCISLHRILSQIIEFSQLGEKFFNIITTPQLSMTMYREKFKEQYKQLTAGRFSHEQELFFREAYVGARTELFIPLLEGK